MQKIISEISSATFLLALFTGLLYISGDAYISGYLNELALNPQIFTPSFNEALSSGFYMLFLGGVFLVVPAFFIALAFYAYTYMFSEILDVGFVKKILSFFFPKSQNYNSLPKPAFISRLLNFTLTLIVFTVLSALFLFTTYKIIKFSAENGKEAANKAVTELSTSEINEEITIQNETEIGSIIRCSTSHCALYLKSKNIITTVPITSIQRISTPIKQLMENEVNTPHS